MNISTCIRFHDSSHAHINRLKRCLFSLEMQTLKPQEVLIATQAFSDFQLDHVSEVASMFNINLRIINFPNNEGFSDPRSKLLNMLLTESQEDFVHFLDYDDYLYQDAYLIFKQLVDDDNCASLIYFARVDRGFYSIKNGYDIFVYRDQPYSGRTLEDLKIDNFCPLHSYIINKKLACIVGTELSFDESYEVLEDYDFLLRYSKHCYNFNGLDKTIGIYCLRDDNTNTTCGLSNEKNDTSRIAKWDKGREKIFALKQKLGYVEY